MLASTATASGSDGCKFRSLSIGNNNFYRCGYLRYYGLDKNTFKHKFRYMLFYHTSDNYIDKIKIDNDNNIILKDKYNIQSYRYLNYIYKINELNILEPLDYSKINKNIFKNAKGTVLTLEKIKNKKSQN